jgi:myo-inositol-1(or 4)-monophosphatase
MSTDFEGHLNVSIAAVRKAGGVLLDRIGKVHAREKGRADLVTEADLAAQEIVRKTVMEAFPSHRFVGEEDAVGLVAESESAYRWIVDPLDGTTNYVHQVPFFCTSLALEHNGQIVVAAIYDPCRDECFTAIRGQGAKLNGQPIRTSNAPHLADSLVSAGFATVVTPDSPDLRLFNAIVGVCQAMRRTGSAALNLAYVAAGRFDAAYAFGAKIWDFAAGLLLVEEAGGIVSDWTGSPLRMQHSHFLAAANPTVHREIREFVR